MPSTSNNICNICRNHIEPARVELNLNICFTCAERTVQRVKGDMNYQHKTAPTLMVMSPAEHANYRRYVPYGKYTGRGSGTHVMSRPVTSLK
jgi:hypothetical protein